MTNKYRIRQCADCFLLERLGHNGFEPCWLIIEQGYGWNYAETTAYLYRCEII